MLKFIPNAGVTAILVDVVRWPLLFVLVAAALSLVYRYAPCRATPRWRPIIWTSMLAAAVWLGVASLFSWYVANFGNYNQNYGELGVIVGFMTWMWLSIVVVLLGAKLEPRIASGRGARDLIREQLRRPG